MIMYSLFVCCGHVATASLAYCEYQIEATALYLTSEHVIDVMAQIFAARKVSRFDDGAIWQQMAVRIANVVTWNK
jgi:predicted CoA-binding protein